MYWAAERLGAERLKGGYALKQLLQQNGWLPLGTDFPLKISVLSKPSWLQFSGKTPKSYPAGASWRMHCQEKKRFVWYDHLGC